MGQQEVDLNRVKEQFACWRRKKHLAKTKRVPEYLWRAATELCGRYSTGRVRNELVLDYKKLKDRVQACGQREPSKSFVTIELPKLCVPEQTTCEWVRPDGAKLRVKMTASLVKQTVADFLGGQQ